MKIKAVLFDLDGTLRDTRQLIYDSVKHAVGESGGPDLGDTDLQEHIEHHTKVHQQFAPHVSVDDFEQIYFATLFKGLPDVDLYEKAAELLQELHSQGIKIAIVSSAGPDEIVAFLKRAGIRAHVDAIVGDNGVLARKPAPEPVLAAMRQIDVSAQDCAMVGDMRVDMLAAAAAHVPVRIGITHGFEDKKTLRAAGATHIVDSLAELPAVLGGAKP